MGNGPVTEEEALIRYGVMELPDVGELENVFKDYLSYDSLEANLAGLVSEPSEGRFANHFHSSSDLKPGVCLRRTVYSISKIPSSEDTYNPDYHLTSIKGDAVHGDYQKAFEDSGLVLVGSDGKPLNEVTLDSMNVSPEDYYNMEHVWNISGRMDSVVWFRGKPHILDIKTVDNEKLYDEKKKVWWLKTVVEYFYQVRFYLKVYVLPTGEKVDRGLIYVVNRDNLHDTRLYVGSRNDDILTLPLNDLIYAEKLRKERKLFPKRPKEHFCRNMCEYFSICDPFDEKGK